MMHSSIGIFYGYLFPPLRGNPWVSHGISTGLPRATHSFNSIAPKASPTDIRKVYVRLHSESSEPTMLLSQTTPDEHPPTPPLCRWPAITLPTLAKFQLVWRCLCDVVLCCSPPPASSSKPLRPSVCYPSMSQVVNICVFVYFVAI